MAEQLVGDIAIETIDRIMATLGYAKRLDIDFTVNPNATFEEAMQYIWRYAGKGVSESDSRRDPRWRIDRYVDAINQARCPDPKPARIQHIDLGCGGGTFAWALLEWCQGQGTNLNQITLYSYDHAINMLAAANSIHKNLQMKYPNIPDMNIYHDHNLMLNSIAASPSEPTHHIITAGYVLANNNDGQTIKDFTNITSAIRVEADYNPCSLIVCDTLNNDENNGWVVLEPAYRKFIDSLEANGVTVNNEKSLGIGTRIAELHRQGA